MRCERIRAPDITSACIQFFWFIKNFFVTKLYVITNTCELYRDALNIIFILSMEDMNFSH